MWVPFPAADLGQGTHKGRPYKTLRRAVPIKSDETHPAVPLPRDDDEFASPRLAVAGLLFGVALMIGWLWLAGMRHWVAALLVVLLLGYFVVFARIRGEAGLGMGVLLRYGGLRVFRAAVPFFIGLVVGDMLSEGIWGAFAAWVALAL